jgi:plastocyanin
MLSMKAARLGATGVIALFFAAAVETPSAGETAIKVAVNPAAIHIDNFSYSPPTLIVAPGTTVTWTNNDDDAHTVVEKDRKFKSAALDTGETFSQTFSAAGEYEYFCSLHPRMVGKIVVKPEKPSS